jgi:hypothetical protein
MADSVMVPATVKMTLAPATLSAIEAALAPPLERRARGTLELELEAKGEGTFTLTYKGGQLSGKKGFARAPLLSARLDPQSWALLREQLQAAVDGFPKAPALAERQRAFLALEQATLDDALAAIGRLKEGLSIQFLIAGAGSITVARGPLDEATDELVVGLDAAVLRAVLAGGDPAAVRPSISGNRGVATAVLAALGPVARAVRLTS